MQAVRLRSIKSVKPAVPMRITFKLFAQLADHLPPEVRPGRASENAMAASDSSRSSVETPSSPNRDFISSSPPRAT